MANVLKDNPWTLDTPGATVLFSTFVKVRHFEWSDFAAGNAVTIQDKNGNEVWRAVAPATVSESEVRSGGTGWHNGLILSALTGGRVKVFWE